jgi:hypothetical protein
VYYDVFFHSLTSAFGKSFLITKFFIFQFVTLQSFPWLCTEYPFDVDYLSQEVVRYPKMKANMVTIRDHQNRGTSYYRILHDVTSWLTFYYV